MRETHICPKCKFNRILQIAQVPDVNDHGLPDEKQNRAQNMRIAVTFAGTGWFGSEKTSSEGALSACVCKRCGFTELYTAAPETIPIDGKYVSELVGPEPEGPFR